VALCGVQLVGHGVDRGAELLAHAFVEVTGVVDDDHAARRPCLVQLPRSVERAGDVVEAVNQRGGDVRDPGHVGEHLVVGQEAAVSPVVRHQPGEDHLPGQLAHTEVRLVAGREGHVGVFPLAPAPGSLLPYRLIRAGHAEVVLAGGAEAPLTPLSFGAFDVIHAMSTANDTPSRAYRPFDRDRDGFVMAEGAAVLVLEELQHAVQRGAMIFGEVLGYGLTNDAHHMTAPHPQGDPAARAMQLALQEAQVAPQEIGYINAHGSSTPLNDKIETRAIKQVFGERAYAIPVSSTKALHAHAFGATGAIEVVICCLALQHHYLPPTINYVTPDPECDLNYLPNRGSHATVDYILKNSFGFGGINATLVLKRYRPEHEAAHHTL